MSLSVGLAAAVVSSIWSLFGSRESGHSGMAINWVIVWQLIEPWSGYHKSVHHEPYRFVRRGLGGRRSGQHGLVSLVIFMGPT